MWHCRVFDISCHIIRVKKFSNFFQKKNLDFTVMCKYLFKILHLCAKCPLKFIIIEQIGPCDKKYSFASNFLSLLSSSSKALVLNQVAGIKQAI